MASHHQTTIPGARLHIEPRNMALAMGDHETRRAIEARLAKPRHVAVRPPLLDRLADFFGSDRGISFMLGFLSGALFCCGSLILLSKVFS